MWQIKLVFHLYNTYLQSKLWNITHTTIEPCFTSTVVFSIIGALSASSCFMQQPEPETFLHQAMHHLSLCANSLLTRFLSEVTVCFDPSPSPLMGKVSCLQWMLNHVIENEWAISFILLDLSWVKWKSFMLGERKGQRRRRNLPYVN